MLERQQRDIMAPRASKTSTSTPAVPAVNNASTDSNGIGRVADPTKIEDVVDEDNAYAVFVGMSEYSEQGLAWF